MGEFLLTLLGIYTIGFVLHALLMSFTWLCTYEESKMWHHKQPPELTYAEVVIWTFIWPIADIIWVAKFLAPGVVALWRRL